MRERFGRHFLKVDILGFGVLLLAFSLTGFALGQGVHCPQCDSVHLSADEFVFWERYFVAKDGVYFAATLLLAIASPFATPRRWPFVLGFFLALFALGLTPR